MKVGVTNEFEDDKSKVEFNAPIEIENVDEVANLKVEDLEDIAEVLEAATPITADPKVISPDSVELLDMFLQAGQSTKDKGDSFDNPHYEVEISV